MIKHWTPQEYAALRRIRERFLNGTAGAGDYWRVASDVALYDSTFAERIGWKWDAVLGELLRREWRPRSTHLLDWGCGSGIANRRVLAEWPQFSSAILHDRSRMARDYAAQRVRQEFPTVAVSDGPPVATRETLLLVSHVINELPPAELEGLVTLAREAGEVIWVEAGTHADSRRLIEVRERLLGDFVAVAPCTHQARCGMLAAANAPHWCHHFATPPSAIFQDARWADFSRELGIDLRSLPYSFLVLSRPGAQPATPEGYSRIIGEPRESKGFARILSCQESGVADLMMQKRDAPELFRAMKKGTLGAVQRWKLEGGRIVGGLWE